MAQTIPKFGANVVGTANISACGAYRYSLSRIWSNHEKPALLGICMLNPSTADGHEDDPTIRRCMNFAHRDGYDGLFVFNIFAYRTKSVVELFKRSQDHDFDIVGPLNIIYSQKVISIVDNVIVAWGNNIKEGLVGWEESELLLESIIYEHGNPYCLGTTKSNQPKHPLYLSGETGLEVYQR
jgi:hypothetical protein